MAVNDERSREITRRELLRRLSAAIAAGGLANCMPTDSVAPGGNGVIPDAPAPGSWYEGSGIAGTPVSIGERGASFLALENTLAQMTNEATGRASPSELLRYLVQRPELSTVGYSATGDVYAIFTDGRPWIIAVDNRKIPGEGFQGGAAAAGSRPSLISSPRSDSRLVLPAGEFEAGIPGKQFRHLCCFVDNPNRLLDYNTWCRPDEVYMSDISDGSRLMTSFGYEVVDPPTAFHLNRRQCEVNRLKQVAGDGVFYWATHGGSYDYGSEVVPVLMTTTHGLPEVSEDIYFVEFQAKMLTYYTNYLCYTPTSCNSADSGPQTKVAITPEFIKRQQWSFGPYSLVFVNASGSASPEMSQAFIDAGASIYLGWNNVVHVPAQCAAALDFFSLMLGCNENEGGSPVTPRQRPYDWGASLFHLWDRTASASYIDADLGPVQLTGQANFAVDAAFMCLRPSIFWNTFDETRSELNLGGGMFGPAKQKVLMGTQLPLLGTGPRGSFGSKSEMPVAGTVKELDVVDWQSQNIVVKVPRIGDGSAGIVQVQVDGRWSNGAQLTRVTLPFEIEQNHGGTLRLFVQGGVYFRGDFRGVRINPAEELRYLPRIQVKGVFTNALYLASGSYSFVDPTSGAPTTVAWSGSGTIDPQNQDEHVAFNGYVNPELALGFFQIAASQLVVLETTTTRPGEPEEFTMVRELSLSAVSPPYAPDDPYGIPVHFTADYFANPVIQEETVAQGSRYNNQELKSKYNLGAFVAEYPPKTDLGGR